MDTNTACYNLSTVTSNNTESLALDSFVPLFVYISASIFLTVCGNLVVIISIVHYPSLHTPTNFLICSLAVTDLLIGLFVLPVSWIFAMPRILFSGDVRPLALLVSDLSLGLVSVFHLVALNVDRYIAITRPLDYYRLVTAPRVVIAISMMWILGCLPITLMLLILILTGRSDPGTEIFTAKFFLSYSCIVFMGPFLLACVIYVRIYVITLRHIKALSILPTIIRSGPPAGECTRPGGTSQRGLPTDDFGSTEPLATTSSHSYRDPRSTSDESKRASTLDQSTQKRVSHGHRRALKMIALVLGTFGVCVGVTYITPLVYISRADTTDMREIAPFKGFDRYAAYFLYANSWLNPLIYGAFNKELRDAFKRILRCGRPKAAVGVVS